MYYYIVLEREVKAMAQMGRPKTDKPKDKRIAIRVDAETHDKIKTYCENNNTSISELFNRFIEMILGK